MDWEIAGIKTKTSRRRKTISALLALKLQGHTHEINRNCGSLENFLRYLKSFPFVIGRVEEDRLNFSIKAQWA